MAAALPCDASFVGVCPRVDLFDESMCVAISRSKKRRQRLRKVAVRKALIATKQFIGHVPFLWGTVGHKLDVNAESFYPVEGANCVLAEQVGTDFRLHVPCAANVLLEHSAGLVDIANSANTSSFAYQSHVPRTPEHVCVADRLPSLPETPPLTQISITHSADTTIVEEVFNCALRILHESMCCEAVRIEACLAADNHHDNTIGIVDQAWVGSEPTSEDHAEHICNASSVNSLVADWFL